MPPSPTPNASDTVAIPLGLLALSAVPFLSRCWARRKADPETDLEPSHEDSQSASLPVRAPSTSLSNQSETGLERSAEPVDINTTSKPFSNLPRPVNPQFDGDFINQDQFWRGVKFSKVVVISLIALEVILRCFQLGYHAIKADQDHSFPTTYRILEDLLLIAVWSTAGHELSRSLFLTSISNHWRSTVHVATLTSAYAAWCLCDLLLPTSYLHLSRPPTTHLQWWLSSIDALVGLAMAIITLTIPRAPRMIYQSPYVPLSPSSEEPRLKARSDPSTSPDQALLQHSESQQENNSLNMNGNVTWIASCSVLDYLFFNWVNPVVKVGTSNASLEKEDLPHLTSDFRSWNLYKKVKDSIEKASQGQIGLMKFVGRSPKWMNPLLWRVLKINQTAFLTQTALALLNSVLYYAPAFFLQKLLKFLEKDDEGHKPISLGYVYCAGLLVAMLAESLVSGQLWYLSNSVLCARIRIQLNTAIYAKTLRRKDVIGLPSTAESEVTNPPDNMSATHVQTSRGPEGLMEPSSGRAAGGDNLPPSTSSKQKKSMLEADEIGLGTKSQVLNLFTIDADRVANFGMSCFSMIDAPSEVIIGTIFLYNLLGFASIVGIAVSVLFIPLNHYTSKWYALVQDRLMVARDRRVSLMNEVLSSIRMIKYMAWETPFEDKILRSRVHELEQLRKNFLLEISFNFIWLASPIFCILTSFLWFTKVEGKELTPAIAFTSLAVFGELKFALNTLPETFINALQCLVSLHRIESYLSSPDCNIESNVLDDLFGLTAMKNVTDRENSVEATSDGPSLQCAIRSATITWPTATMPDDASPEACTPMTPSRRRFYLEDITADFPEKQMTLICGPLGSGKTLLLLALLGEAELLAGQIICPRSPPNAITYLTHLDEISEAEWQLPICSYAPQSAWLQNADIRTNILFGLPLVKKRYEATLYACSLTRDLKILEDGDQTEIGEKGVNLSGGQKARISLARAIYSRSSTVLLDDVLSAVDAHTARHIVDHCFKGSLMKDRTLILVSHHVQLCAPIAAHVVCLDNGSVDFSASGEEFMRSRRYRALSGIDPIDDDEGLPPKSPIAATTPKNFIHGNSPSNIADNMPTFNDNTMQETAADGESDGSDSESEEDLDNAKPPRKLVEDESRAVGHVQADVFKLYLSSTSNGLMGTSSFWFIFTLVFVGNKVLDVLETYVLSLWSGSNDGGESASSILERLSTWGFGVFAAHHSVDFYLGLYTAVTLINVVVSTVRWLVLYEGAISASEKLYKSILHAVLRSPLRFFDTVPLGRLLNRFGKDFEGIDSALPDNLGHSLIYSLDVGTTILSVTAVTPTFLAAFFVITIAYWHYGRQYTQIARELRRLDSVTKSPLFSAYSETIAGVGVIRAFGGCSRALAVVFEKIDTNVSCYFYLWSVNRWLSIRYSLLASLLVGLTGFFLLQARHRISASLAGFALTFALKISGDMLFLVRRFTALELSMVAVERVKEFSEMEAEAPEIVEPRPPANWPHSGEIVVDKLTVRYAPELPDVLHSVSFHIPARGKVGIVGATGCGKSTLAQAFFRFVEARDGCIKIDGLDIKNIGLGDLRSRLTIIPQDPTILSGSLRSTLDVFDEHSDVDIYGALRRVNLIPSHEAEDDGFNENVFRNLDTEVSEQGMNFSQGQRQLLCMARALLKRSKVLLMDEATSSIDNKSEALISQTIRQEFSDSTLLVIAHRLRTIIDFDCVLVLDAGKVVEYDSPAKLLANSSSRFHDLCRASGKREFKTLKRIASIRTNKSPEL